MVSLTKYRERLTYNAAGYLRGKTPIKQTLSLDTKDQAEHTMFYSGKVIAMKDLAKDLERIFGIAPRPKRSGSQEGYPAEPVIRAMWRYFVDRYNNGDPEVEFSHTPH